MSEKLKPCPFCGDEVEIFETGLYHWNYAIRHKSKEECVLDAIAFVLPFEKDKAMRMWNERAEGEVQGMSELIRKEEAQLGECFPEVV